MNFLEDVSFSNIKKDLLGLKNFYMIGQWVVLGGGLPPAIMKRRNVTQIICKEDKKKFKVAKYIDF